MPPQLQWVFGLTGHCTFKADRLSLVQRPLECDQTPVREMLQMRLHRQPRRIHQLRLKPIVDLVRNRRNRAMPVANRAQDRLPRASAGEASKPAPSGDRRQSLARAQADTSARRVQARLRATANTRPYAPPAARSPTYSSPSHDRRKTKRQAHLRAQNTDDPAHALAYAAPANLHPPPRRHRHPQRAPGVQTPNR